MILQMICRKKILRGMKNDSLNGCSPDKLVWFYKYYGSSRKIYFNRRKNGNGKSVLLDAIKYTAFGDVVFNKSSETKGGRTVISYTRGLLDATAKTYMRPADKYPNVYTHIVLEFLTMLIKSILFWVLLLKQVPRIII